MACFQCGDEKGNSLQLCPSCVQAKITSHKEELATKAQVIDLLAKETDIKQKQLQLAATALTCMIFLLLGLLYHVGAFGFGTLGKPALAASSSSSRLTTLDPCKDKERCVIVFLSPNNPDSVKVVPVINILLAKTTDNKRVASQIVLGSGTAQELDSFAKLFAAESYIDFQGDFVKQIQPKSIPSWWVIDSNRHVVMRGRSLPLPTISESSTFSEMVEAYLKMPTYF